MISLSRSEKAIFTNMCMVENGDWQILNQDRFYSIFEITYEKAST